MGIKDIVSDGYMSDNEHFADAFNYYVFSGEKVIRPEDLSTADAVEMAIITRLEKTLSTKKIRDVIKTLNIKQDENITYIILGIENQSEIHYAMPVRNMLYDALNYASQVSVLEKELRKTKRLMHGAEYLSGLTKTDKLFPVITLVINWSDKKWDGPIRLSEMFVDTDPRIMRCVNDYELRIIDPHDINDFRMFNTMLGDVLEFIKYQNDEGYLQRAIKEKGDDWSLDVESIKAINTFTGAKISTNEAKEGIVNMCRATEAILEQGIEQGREQGIVQGIEKGTNVINTLNQILIDTGRLDDLKRSTTDKEYQNKLIKELVTPNNK